MNLALPSEAVPVSVISDWELITAATPSRNNGWPSTLKIRMQLAFVISRFSLPENRYHRLSVSRLQPEPRRVLLSPYHPFLQKTSGRWVTSTDLLAAAMLHLAVAGSARKTLNTAELNDLARNLSD